MRLVVLFFVVLLMACGGDDDGPPAGSAPNPTGGQGGNQGQGGSGAAGPLPACDDANVACTTENYYADCTATPDRSPLWKFLSYETTILTDAQVAFLARTADDEAALGMASYHVASIATLDEETVPPSVPVLLENVLGPADKTNPYLELQLMTIDSTDGATPTIVSYELTFTCEEF